MFHDSEKSLRKQVISGESGFDLLFSNDFQTLLTSAEAYSALGWSVIPLLGDRDLSRPKVPALPWSNFQQSHAALTEHHQWFAEAGFGGIGIVTGHISHLVVLDFDSEEIFKDFRLQYPDLTETRTVHSAGRQLPHLYFKLHDHLHLPSQKGQGIDLLSDGRYVVAPPTTINGQAYKITRGGMPRTLTERDIRRLQAFFSRHSTYQLKKPPPNAAKPITICSKPMKSSEQDLSRLYRYYCQQGGRNEALFRTSLHARDTGWQLHETQQYLVPLHGHQPSTSSHHKETQAQRQREALTTIRSAFSKPARPLKNQAVRQQGYVSNSVREALMQHKMTYVVRTYEGLLQAGVKPGQLITAKEAVELLKGLVGRDSVLKSLKAGHGKLPFFSLPVNPSKTANAVATDNSLIESKKCFFEGSKNQQKIKKGRPQRLFTMPTNDDLCRVLGVLATGSDQLGQDDLTSAPKTRMALHRELIKRRPGSYPRGWLARRLGVNKRTIATYNRIIPIHSRTLFTETSINWKNIQRLPFDEPLQGAVLVAQAGKRYPALRTIASRLLARGEGICLKQQTANFYWYGDMEPLLTRLQIQQTAAIEQERIESFVISQQEENPMILNKPVSIVQPLLQHPIIKKGKAAKTSHQNLHKPLTDIQQEALANLIYTTINGEGRKTLSLANARHITLMHSEKPIRAALNFVRQRNGVVNPIGFLKTILRSKSH